MLVLYVIMGFLAIRWIRQEYYKDLAAETERIDIEIRFPTHVLSVFSMTPEELQQLAVNLEKYLKDSTTITPSWNPTGIWIEVKPTYPRWLAALSIFPYRKFVPMKRSQMVRFAIESLGDKPQVTVVVQGDFVVIKLPPFYVPKE